MSKLRLGMLGVSWWTDVVWPGFSLVEDAEVTWIAARTGEKAERFAAEHGIPHWSDDYRRVIEAPEVDAVFIGVPNFLHHELAIAALQTGKHVLQEKPMALSVAEAEAQASLAEERGLTLMVDMESRLAPAIRDIPRLMEERLGPLSKVLIGMTMAPRNWTGWRGDRTLSGGSLFELAIHHLDLARHLFGRNPLSVWGTGTDFNGNDMSLVFDYGEGDTALIDYCWRSVGFRLRVEAYGRRGWVRQEMELPFGDCSQTITTAECVEESIVPGGLQGPDTFRRMLQSFVDAVRSGNPPAVPAEDGVWAVRMAYASREALKSGEKVQFT